MDPSPRHHAALVLAGAYRTTAELTATVSRDRLRMLVRSGALLRLRNGRYVLPDLHPALLDAGRLGARLDCVSLLAALGVFVQEHARLHVQIERGSSRLPPRMPGTTAHWRRTACARAALATEIVGALAQAVRCQRPREAIATLDSAWHQGLVGESEIAAVFAALPCRYRPLRALLDRRSESGPETLVRLMLRALGCAVELQVVIDGVGRVDLLVDGWLIVECDSRAFHEGWDAAREDRRRDLAAAAQGYTTVRVLAEDVMYRGDEVLGALRAALSHPRAPRNSSIPAPRRR
ncbi:hypothetical protein N3K63_00750 [Microbacterium sp. W1N]|uniref:endonuclease domain-containing protein n=1 Tax=Microbacterium festucae TaxID=2977531 RepID=UPI0021BFDE31|nr:hypothetical protein [Microbacterium festucae]MCT9818805.1 hypothetical protein [Microbacterium festucae]